MDRLIALCFIVVTLGGMTSCSHNTQFATEISSLDSLQIETQILQSRLDSLPLEKIEEIQPQLKEKYDYLRTHLSDSNRQFWISEMSYLRQSEKSMRRFVSNKTKVAEQLATNAKQQASLINSLRDKKLSSEEVEGYVMQEYTAYQETQLLAFKTIKATVDGLKIWAVIEPSVDSTVTFLKEHNTALRK